MKIQLYFKKDIIGLCFENQSSRDTLWTQLGEHQNCAERFGERTIRFDPSKATINFSIPLETDTPRVVVIKQAEPQPKLPDLPKTTMPFLGGVMVVPTAPAPIEPIAIIPVEKPVFGDPPSLPTTSIAMPQIGSVDALGIPAVIKPPDLRSRAGRAWKAAQATK